MTNNGMIKVVSGLSKKTGKPYRALHYYVWAKEATNANTTSTAMPQVPQNQGVTP
jgi:hypothetical protein